LTATQSERLLESRSGVKMLLECVLGKNEHERELISDASATLAGQSPLSLGRECLDELIKLPLTYRLVSDLQDYLIG
jgi:hypothetical protein